MTDSQKLRIVHCFRSPVGGIFRHVRDLVGAQSAAGHSVGIICDSSTGGSHEERLFESIRPDLALGLVRIPMDRAIRPSDALALWRAFRETRKLRPDILHSHGAKGGAYARLIGTALRISGLRIARLYCPHGGSIHYDAASLSGRLYFLLERLLETLTDRLIFVSKYERDGYIEKIGRPRRPYGVIYNGLAPEEFKTVKPGPQAADFLYIGMMRDLKGPDLFLKALCLLRDERRRVFTAHFAGDGPDKDKYRALITELKLGGQVTVHDAMPARLAFAKARIVVAPSRAESMPYLVLEAIAAGMPIIATDVGGIPEIFEAGRGELVKPNDAAALASAMLALADAPDRAQKAAARQSALQSRFSVKRMAADIETAYRACF